MKSLKSLFLVAIASFMFWTCAEINPDGYYKLGKVTGTVYNENGTRTIGGAKVQIDINGDIFFTQTDADGNFVLDAPEGTHELFVYTGSGRMFRMVATVAIEWTKTTVLEQGSLRLPQVADLAYIPGAYDKIESIIIDSLGYSATAIAVSDLDNLSTLQQYDAIFLNCGKSAALDSTRYANLRQYCLSGGAIYASDWAVEYLTGDGNFLMLPPTNLSDIADHNTMESERACVGDVGGFIPDADLCTQKVGPGGLVSNADIVAPSIQALLSATTIDIDYDLGAWEVVQEISSAFTILIEDNNNGFGPLAMRYLLNDGSLASNSDGQFVTICHVPPGNPANAHTITVSVSSLPAHLSHGDYIGPCQHEGNILYTTFHNHHQGNISHEIYDVLEYFILNL